ncbi:MAG: hypothetical protein AW07_03673 [Candidatus Accumulibacter sp. SK-11]|nr:MAG: hypothetical protein AW07_03673 [Candidatus Accumulibacter sp. SK-11]
MRRSLHRHQQPLIGLRQPGGDRAISGGLLGLGLGDLIGGQVELHLLGEDRLPRQVFARRFVEILQAGLVGRQEDQRIPVQARRIATRLQHGPRGNLAGAVPFLAVRMIDAQHDQPCIQVVGNVRPGRRHRMNAREVALALQILAQALFDLLRHLVRIALGLLGAVFGQFGHRRLRRIPVMRSVLIEVGRRAGHPAQGVTKHRRRFARHRAAEFHAPILDPLVRGGGGRRRAHVDRARHPPARRDPAQVGQVPVELQRQRVRPVDILLDHRHPVVGEVARQFGLHARVVDRHVAGQDQRIAVALLPQAVDHRRHQPQHAARALEFHQRRPVGIQPVEDFRVDRVRCPDAFLVVGFAALGRKLRLLRAVELGEGARHHVPVLELRRVGKWLEQAPANDLEAFFGTGRPPRGFDTPDDVAQPVERLAATRAADFDIVRLRVWQILRRAGGIRRRQADHQQAVLRQLGRFRQHLRKAELRLEAAGRQVALVLELARVGDLLVDQDHAGAVIVEQLAQRVAGAGCLLVVSRQPREGWFAAKLPGQFAPQRAHDRTVGLGRRVPRRNLVAYQHHAPGRRNPARPGGRHHFVDAGQLGRRDAREQMVERQHRVRLAATEVGLQLHDRVAAAGGQALHRGDQHPLQAFGQVGAAEELHRVPVFVSSLAEMHLP